VWSVLLAIGNVIFKILPYFIIADVVKLFLNGEKEFEKYLIKAVPDRTVVCDRRTVSFTFNVIVT
jgi:hypothetical protein